MRVMNSGDFGFRWMKVVFDRWDLFGIDWVKKFCEFVEI